MTLKGKDGPKNQLVKIYLGALLVPYMDQISSEITEY